MPRHVPRQRAVRAGNQSEQATQQRGLAAAVAPFDQQEFACRQCQVDTLNNEPRVRGAVAEAKFPEFEQGRGYVHGVFAARKPACIPRKLPSCWSIHAMASPRVPAILRNSAGPPTISDSTLWGSLGCCA